LRSLIACWISFADAVEGLIDWISWFVIRWWISG
jgi:hypothetical protein